MSENDCIGGGNVLHTMAILNIENLGHRFVGNLTQHSTRTSASTPAPAPAPASAPAAGLVTPDATLTRMSSLSNGAKTPSPHPPDWLQLDAAENGSSSRGAQGGIQSVTNLVALQKKLINYRGQNVEAGVCDFLLTGVCVRKSESTLAKGTSEFVAPPDLPHLALLARPYPGVEVTSCHFFCLFRLASCGQA